MINLISKLTKSTLDLVFPLECVGCQKEGDVLCPACLGNVTRLGQPYCRLCAQPGQSSPCASCRESPLDLDALRAPFLLGGAIQEAVHAFKYRNLRAAAPRLGGLLGEFLTYSRITGEVLIPVPLHSSRQRQRGYNQSDLLAQQVSKTTGWSGGAMWRAAFKQDPAFKASPSSSLTTWPPRAAPSRHVPRPSSRPERVRYGGWS